MNYYTIFKAIKEEYGEEIALTAVQIYTINLTPSFIQRMSFMKTQVSFCVKRQGRFYGKMMTLSFCVGKCLAASTSGSLGNRCKDLVGVLLRHSSSL